MSDDQNDQPDRLERLSEALEAHNRGKEAPAEDDETSVPQATGKAVRAEEKLPEQIGPYKLLEAIGEGGMGTVYLAEQRVPVKRKVALKIIKIGMDSKEVIARFESERQALAMMNHPNIARVLDAGTSEQGRPYFVMEHVPGVPITRYCDAQRLTTKERLHLFIQVCDAVQHSHQKGVIHRDIKPSNVLVTAQQGDKPQAKIIDFGIAKATEHKLTEKTLFTGQGQMIGTPEYMSPEQTDMVGIDVDTRSDIYSLGVLLYELLVGQVPFALPRAAFLEIVHKIREQEPPRPSARITTVGGTATEIARARGTDPRTLVREVSGDLDWITLRAMEKDRTRRYSTASELMLEVERYLAHEPVLAGPPGLAYRTSKFVRRHKGVAAGFVVVVVSLLVAFVGVLVGYLAALESERSALEAEKKAVVAGQREREQRLAAEHAKQLAEERHRQIVEWEALADVGRLTELTVRAETLWPAYPESIAACEEWLRSAKELASTLDAHRASLARIRETEAVPLDAGSDGEGRPESKGPRIGEITWKFNSREAQWRHDLLATLVDDLEVYRDPNPEIGLIAAIESRLANARSIWKKTIEIHAAEWERAIASIADQEECPFYNGLRIEPQFGLVPIGQDSRSRLWEFALVQSGKIPNRGSDRRGFMIPWKYDLYMGGQTCLVFILIPGGEFWMGSQKASEDSENYDLRAESREAPVKKVRIEPFFISKYEMTQGQWKRIARTNPSAAYKDLPPSPGSGTDRHPVESVSWHESMEVMRRLNLRLPTEAQWEYAARAQTTTVFWTGNDLASLVSEVTTRVRESNEKSPEIEELSLERSIKWLKKVENLDLARYLNSEYDLYDDSYAAHTPVGEMEANGFGLHDVHGNVAEWCSDLYSNYAAVANPEDGRRLPLNPCASSRIVRGGSFRGSVWSARSASRSLYQTAVRRTYLGLRPARRLTTE